MGSILLMSTRSTSLALKFCHTFMTRGDSRGSHGLRQHSILQEKNNKSVQKNTTTSLRSAAVKHVSRFRRPNRDIVKNETLDKYYRAESLKQTQHKYGKPQSSGG